MLQALRLINPYLRGILPVFLYYLHSKILPKHDYSQHFVESGISMDVSKRCYEISCPNLNAR